MPAIVLLRLLVGLFTARLLNVLSLGGGGTLLGTDAAQRGTACLHATHLIDLLIVYTHAHL